MSKNFIWVSKKPLSLKEEFTNVTSLSNYIQWKFVSSIQILRSTWKQLWIKTGEIRVSRPGTVQVLFFLRAYVSEENGFDLDKRGLREYCVERGGR